MLTVDNSVPIDLIANGTFAECGGRGTPYLYADDHFQKYHLQVWGYLTNSPKYKWYGDTTVSKPELVTDFCLNPPKKLKALKIQEGFWTNFYAVNGIREQKGSGRKNGWTMFGDGNFGPDGIPDGTGIVPGRTVWYAQGQIPYFLTGRPDGGRIVGCVAEMPKNIEVNQRPSSLEDGR